MTLSTPLQPTSVSPDALLAPASQLFAQRAARLDDLANQHTQAPWLRWLGHVCRAQQASADHFPEQTQRSPGHAAAAETLQHVFQHLRAALANAAALPHPPALHQHLAMNAAELAQRAALNLDYLRGERSAEGRDLGDVLVAASLQVAWQDQARQQIGAGKIAPHSGGQCPCCGSAAIGSLIFAGDGKGGLRYLECSLCATRWHAVRARCTLCASDAVVTYLGLEGQRPAVQAEACPDCHGYSKIFNQGKDIQIDPTADDLATLALDILVSEQGYARGAPNLFLCDVA